MTARILIIEDSRPNRVLMATLLKAYGYVVEEAPTGEAVLELIEQQDVDLIVCDMHLPGIGGMELVQKLRKHPRAGAVPVVAVTALNAAGDRERILLNGFDGFIPKPIEPRKFVPTLEDFLPRELRSRTRPDGGSHSGTDRPTGQNQPE